MAQLRVTAQNLLFTKSHGLSQIMAFLLAHLSTFSPLLLCSLAAQQLTLLRPALAKLKEANSQNSTLSPAYQCLKAMTAFYPYPINGNFFTLITFPQFAISQQHWLISATCRRSVGAQDRMSTGAQKSGNLTSGGAGQALDLVKLKR